MKEEGKNVSISQIFRWFNYPRSTFYYEPEINEPRVVRLDQALVEMIRKIIAENPDYGIRRISAVLRNQLLIQVNRKKCDE